MRYGWDKPITDWIPEIKSLTNKEIIKLSRTAFNKIKQRTPVRSGRLQAGWYMQQMIDQGVLSVSIVNDIEYVTFVEYGTDKMAGKYMVEQTLNELAEGTL